MLPAKIEESRNSTSETGLTDRLPASSSLLAHTRRKGPEGVQPAALHSQVILRPLFDTYMLSSLLVPKATGAPAGGP